MALRTEQRSAAPCCGPDGARAKKVSPLGEAVYADAFAEKVQIEGSSLLQSIDGKTGIEGEVSIWRFCRPFCIRKDINPWHDAENYRAHRRNREQVKGY